VTTSLIVPEDHFSAVARDYVQRRPAYPRRLATVLAERAPGRALAVDCGCGSGQLSVPLAGSFRRVIGVDVSAAQINHAVRVPALTYLVASAERTGLRDHCADLIVAAQAAHWFDLPRFWEEVDRVARPGALVALIGYGRVSVAGHVGDLITDFHDRILRAHWSPRRHLLLDGYKDIPFPYQEVAAPPIEMTVTWSFDQLIGYLGTWSAVARAEQATGESPIPGVARRLAGLWGDPETTTTVRWPLFTRLGRVAVDR
jgi:SAM-dependent methyltransferase